MRFLYEAPREPGACLHNTIASAKSKHVAADAHAGAQFIVFCEDPWCVAAAGQPSAQGDIFTVKAITNAEATTMERMTETGCCPRFNPEPWDGREITWRDKPFVRDRVRSVFHIPINFGGVMKRNMQAIEAADALDPDHLLLSDENSLWGADVYIAVSKNVPSARIERLSGTYFTKVFEGPYRHVSKWAKTMTDLLAERGRPLKKLYFWYTTCPKCAKAYGENYVVLVAE